MCRDRWRLRRPSWDLRRGPVGIWPPQPRGYSPHSFRSLDRRRSDARGFPAPVSKLHCVKEISDFLELLRYFFQRILLWSWKKKLLLFIPKLLLLLLWLCCFCCYCCCFCYYHKVNIFSFFFPSCFFLSHSLFYTGFWPMWWRNTYVIVSWGRGGTDEAASGLSSHAFPLSVGPSGVHAAALKTFPEGFTNNRSSNTQDEVQLPNP